MTSSLTGPSETKTNLALLSSQGDLFVISAPSGTGKSTLTNSLCRMDSRLKPSVSYTTRAKREGEVEGQDYFFISESAFIKMMAQEDFLEYAKVFDNFYGTSASYVIGLMKKKLDVILVIDWQGALQIKNILPNAILICILPPSLQSLRERINKRGTDSPQEIEKRLRGAKLEIAQAKHFEHIIINDDFNSALLELHAIIKTYRLKTRRMLGKVLELEASWNKPEKE